MPALRLRSWFRPCWAGYFSWCAPRKCNQKKRTPSSARYAGTLRFSPASGFPTRRPWRGGKASAPASPDCVGLNRRGLRCSALSRGGTSTAKEKAKANAVFDFASAFDVGSPWMALSIAARAGEGRHDVGPAPPRQGCLVGAVPRAREKRKVPRVAGHHPGGVLSLVTFLCTSKESNPPSRGGTKTLRQSTDQFRFAPTVASTRKAGCSRPTRAN